MQLISQSKTERNFRICKLVYSYAMFEIREADARSQVFFKKDVFKKFRKFHEKTTTVFDSLFNKLSGLIRSATLLNTDPNTGVFLSNLGTFIRTPFSTEHFPWLLLKSKKILIFSTFCDDYVAFCFKHVSLQIIKTLFSSNRDWKENIRLQNVSFPPLKFGEWRSAFTSLLFGKNLTTNDSSRTC